MIVVVLLVVGAAWLSRYLVAEKNAKRDGIAGRPPIRRSVLHGTFLSRPARARRLGRPKTGDDGTFASLMAARRFREASRLTLPENHADRARLAVARDAPIVDLKLAARMEFHHAPKDLRPTIIAAQRSLKRIYGGTNWGYAVRPSTGHMVPASEREVIALLTRGRLRTALAVNRRMLRAFPNADAADSWMLNAALIAAILGRSRTSRTLSVALAARGASARFRQQGSRLSRTVGKPVRPVRARRAKSLEARATKALLKQTKAWPISPHGVVDAFANGKAVSERILDRDTLAAALAAGGEVWVGQLRPDATGHAVAVRAFAPSEGAVLLADGSILEWDVFERNSVWGSRMIILHQRREVIPGTEPAARYEEAPFPVDAHGAVIVHPDSLALLKGAVASAGDNELAAFLYSDALHRALVRGVYGIGTGEARRHLAVTAARFPHSNWPLAVIAVMNSGGVGDQSRLLFAAGLEHWFGPRIETEMAKASSLHKERWYHLREANAVMLDTAPLIESFYAAALRGDRVDVDAHLDLLQIRIVGGSDELTRCKVLREVAWRGTMPAWKELSPGRPDSVERTVWRALACQSGNAIALSVVTGKDGAEQYNDDAKFAALCEATHAGDVNAILAATRSYGQINGLDFRAVWGLTFAMPVLCAPTDERVVELAPAVANRAGTLLGEWLLKDRPAWGLALLRAGAREGSDRTGATFALGVALIGRAEQESGGERTQLAEEALATLDAMASGRSYTSVWNYARIAATRLVDPERALDDLRSLERVERPLEAFLLGAALASDVGDEHLASQMRARAANPALLNAAIGSALRLGIDDELTAALGTADAALSASAAWIFYGAGGALAAIPPVPGLGERAVPSGALWRLAREGQREILGRAVAQAYPVSARLATQDGAPRVALTDLGATNAPDLPTVRKMLEGSRHPAYLRAAHIALGWGMDCGLSESELKSAAPGLTFSQVES